MAIIIPIKDNPNHSLKIELEKVLYKLDFIYNTYFNFWSMSIFDEDDNLIVAGVKIVANYPMISHLNKLKGDFICQIANTKAEINRTSFSGSEAILLYLTEAEIEAF